MYGFGIALPMLLCGVNLSVPAMGRGLPFVEAFLVSGFQARHPFFHCQLTEIFAPISPPSMPVCRP